MAKAKQKVTIPGLVGWTLQETAKHHGLLSHCPPGGDLWDYNSFGEGPMSAEDHIVVSKDYFEKLPPASWMEMNILNSEVHDFLTPTSRLATMVTLTKDLDGITVIVPDTNPDLSNHQK